MCHSFSFSTSNFSLFLISFTIYLFSLTPSIFVRNNQWIFQLTALHCRSHRHGGKYGGRGKTDREGVKRTYESGTKEKAEGSHDLKSVLKKPYIGPSWCPTVSRQHCGAAFRHMQPLSRLSLSPSFPGNSTGCSELRHHFSPPHSSLALQRKMCNSHSDTMYHSPASMPGRPPRCIQLYVHVLCYRETGRSLK